MLADRWEDDLEDAAASASKAASKAPDAAASTAASKEEAVMSTTTAAMGTPPWRLWSTWQQTLPMDRRASTRCGPSWLSWNGLCAVCLCCQAAGLDGKFSSASVHLGNLRQHHNCALHQKAAMAYLEQGNGLEVLGAPPASDWERVWEDLAKGVSPSAGINGIGRKKVFRMLFCLNEALKRLDMEFFQQTVCMSVSRDERHGRLAFRFIACNADLQVRQGRLGQARHFGTGAKSITDGTRQVLERATTKFATMPAGCNPGVHSRVKPEPNPNLFQHICATIKMVATDSATDELNSVRNMKNPIDTSPPLAPNMEIIGRDKAHGSRRVMTRPWKVDKTLSALMETFITGKQSLMQRLERSLALRQIFTRHTLELQRGFLKRNDLMVGLRAAKHRFESFASPLAIWCMWYQALLETAKEIVVMRSGVEVASAVYFIESVTTETCIMMALMSDAADDALEFIRSKDSCDNMDICQFNTDVFIYLVRLVELYEKGKITGIFSYTQYMLESLRLEPVMLPATGSNRFGHQQKIIGDSNGVPMSVVKRCLQALSPWVRLSVDVLKAEFPDFELFMCFQVLNLKRNKKEVMQEDREKCIRTLAHALGLDRATLTHQIDLLEPAARVHHISTGQSNAACWAHAVKAAEARTSSTQRADRTSTVRELVYRLLTLKPCTSALEQDFSRTADLLKNTRLNASAGTEEAVIKVVLDRPSMPEERLRVVHLAMKVWREAFGNARESPAGPRADIGTLRTKGVESTDARHSKIGFVRKRRAAAAAVAWKNHRNTAKTVDNTGPGWTEKHDTERDFQRKKRKHRLCEAVNLGHVAPEDVDLVRCVSALQIGIAARI